MSKPGEGRETARQTARAQQKIEVSA